MKIEVIGKNGFIITDAIRDYAIKKISRLERFFDEKVLKEARIVCKNYSGYNKVEVTIPNKVLTLRAEVKDKDMYAALDLVVDKLISQIKKLKSKVNTRFEKEGIKAAFKNNSDDLTSELNATIVRNKSVQLEPMDVEDAVMQMESLGHSFYVFLNKQTFKTNICYLREDGNYAVIEAENKN
ncbi:MAG: ribosome-associated translation inhibitor RaiA [Erysipelotrichales bacterium]|nr:ribosome-associated translation inhibitor RaiA [Erysipelotrichales bacterium]